MVYCDTNNTHIREVEIFFLKFLRSQNLFFSMLTPLWPQFRGEGGGGNFHNIFNLKLHETHRKNWFILREIFKLFLHKINFVYVQWSAFISIQWRRIFYVLISNKLFSNHKFTSKQRELLIDSFSLFPCLNCLRASLKSKI